MIKAALQDALARLHHLHRPLLQGPDRALPPPGP